MQLDERLYWALALGILILRGPGPFSLDRLVEEAFRLAARREAPKDELLPHVVVVGGGFGGIAAIMTSAGRRSHADDLAQQDADIRLQFETSWRIGVAMSAGDSAAVATS